MTDTVLIVLVIVLLAGLVVMQLMSARAARKIGGRSSRSVVVLRIVNATAVTALIVWLLIMRFGG